MVFGIGSLGSIGFGVAGVMGIALWFVGQQYLAEYERRVRADTDLEITRQSYAAEQKMQRALQALEGQYQQRIKTNEKDFTQRVASLTAKLARAKADAAITPLQFGDDIIDEFIRVDCLLSLDPEGADYRSNRQACRDGTAPANATSKELFFAALQPAFWQAQAAVCSEWDTFPHKIDRDALMRENPWFDPSFCTEVLVTMTPETAQYLTIFLDRVEYYTLSLIEVAKQRGEIIHQLAEEEATAN